MLTYLDRSIEEYVLNVAKGDEEEQLTFEVATSAVDEDEIPKVFHNLVLDKDQCLHLARSILEYFEEREDEEAPGIKGSLR